MFDTLTKGFRAARQRLSGAAELTDDVIDDALRDIRMSLLEADVEFKVTKRFLDRVKEAARGEQVKLKAKSKEYGTVKITPQQAFVKIVVGRCRGGVGGPCGALPHPVFEGLNRGGLEGAAERHARYFSAHRLDQWAGVRFTGDDRRTAFSARK